MDKFFGDMSQFLRKATPNRGFLLSDMTHYLEKDFLYPLRRGAVLHLQHETKSGFLKLRIVGHEKKWRQVQYELPDDTWSHAQFDQVHAEMTEAGYMNYVEEIPGNKQFRRLLRVVVEGNYDELTPALLQVLEIAAQHLGFEVTDRYTLRIAGMASFDYMEEGATKIDEKLKRSPLGRGCLGFLLSGVFHRVAKLYDDEP